MAERKRQLVRDELNDAAMRLFAFRGFDETTIEAITEAAGVSRRTFFRYYRSKEDVIVEFIAGLGAALRDTLAARPSGEPPAVALRAAVGVFTDKYDEDQTKALAIARLTLRTPALLGRYLERRAMWQEALTLELAARHRLDPRDMRARLAAGLALDALDTAVSAWVDQDGARPLPELTDEAFALVAPALAAMITENAGGAGTSGRRTTSGS
jgi:AcrR family transcriptional regulator